VAFLREVNATVGRAFPDALMIAEESTAWPGVSRPVDAGGLGFDLKWNMGWMHDSLGYFGRDPVHRRYHHDALTFSLVYAFSERFVLPVSHDEVVHGKRSLLGRMPGDDWQRFANLRAFLGYMWSHPGKKLLFMGCELGQQREWDHDGSIDWNALDGAPGQGVQALVRDLNRVLAAQPALHERDFDPEGFTWLEADARDANVLAYLRWSAAREPVLCLLNLSPLPHAGRPVGVPRPGRWLELLNTDAAAYGGSNVGNLGAVEASGPPLHGQPHSGSFTLPPLAAVWLAPAQTTSA
jgi:1,4-alpha-glucan branching enzyme